MNLSDLNGWGITFCILLIIPGLYLVFKRDHNSIKKGTTEPQILQANKKGARLKVSLGLCLILAGILVFYLMISNRESRPDEINETANQEFFFEGWIKDDEGDVGDALVTIQETADTTRSGSNGYFRMQLSKYYEFVTVSIVAKGYAPSTIKIKSKGTASFELNKN